MEGSHSLFGLIWQIAGATGWSVRYILWKLPYPVLLLMAADAPRYVNSKRKNRQSGRRTADTKALSFFQTRMPR